ncbi:hypothetical protein F3Y22_tig00111402pilonHSYRG00531 [Hibiscus syriacus]|uniref:CCHC-type domain-containing protein n=1 Tax=Hibiscus syriacus TaxID=106335 RepID=A0A6A2XQY9_HIBSY|nr:hypothetical protein F3Y22_tig00111402pilonHSYRG00531 [Hibiscus syriacus]
MPLGTDSNVMKMVQSLPKNRYIHIYAQVKGITESGCYESGGVEVDNAESGGVEMDNAESSGAEMDTAEMGSVKRDNTEMGSVERDNVESAGVEMDSAESAGVEMDNAEMGSVERDNAEMGSVERDNAEMGSVERDNVESVGVEMDNAEMSNVEKDNEKDKSSNEDSDFQETDGENSFDDEESLPSMVEEDVINILGDMGRHEFNNRPDKMFDSSPVNSGELNIDRDSDLDARLTFPEFNKETDIENPKFQKGMLFCSKETLKEAIRQYGRVNRTVGLFKVNDNKRLQAIYSEGCPWKLWSSPLHSHDSDSNTWQIKTYESEHTCAKLLKNKNVSYRFIGMKYIQKFMSDMNYSLTSLKQDVITDYGTFCSLTKCGRAREHALEMIQACKEGFKAGCRRIISLDGCFLKGYYAGYLLAAVGTDANGGIYPIAYAVVESENQYSWLWFLEILGRDLDIDNSYGWCFMSDRQKGLVEAVAELFPNAEARNCVRHIYANFKKDHKGKALKDALWRAARATYARDKPIHTMMKLIRTKIMRRFVCRYEVAEKINRSLCPNIQKKLNIIIDQATRCWATHAGGLKYQVECGPGNQHVVDMGSHSCSCRKWDLTGIPCIHAVAVMQLHNDRPEPYVHTCYHKSTQLVIYSNFICPVKGAKQWTPVIEMEPIMPPELRRPPGRPTKKRRKEADEENKNGPKLSKKGSMGNCSKCGKPGHNKRTCRGEVGGIRSLNQRESRSSQPHTPDQPSQTLNSNATTSSNYPTYKASSIKAKITYNEVT